LDKAPRFRLSVLSLSAWMTALQSGQAIFSAQFHLLHLTLLLGLHLQHSTENGQSFGGK